MEGSSSSSSSSSSLIPSPSSAFRPFVPTQQSPLKRRRINTDEKVEGEEQIPAEEQVPVETGSDEAGTSAKVPRQAPENEEQRVLHDHPEGHVPLVSGDMSDPAWMQNDLLAQLNEFMNNPASGNSTTASLPPLLAAWIRARTRQYPNEAVEVRLTTHGNALSIDINSLPATSGLRPFPCGCVPIVIIHSVQPVRYEEPTMSLQTVLEKFLEAFRHIPEETRALHFARNEREMEDSIPFVAQHEDVDLDDLQHEVIMCAGAILTHCDLTGRQNVDNYVDLVTVLTVFERFLRSINSPRFDTGADFLMRTIQTAGEHEEFKIPTYMLVRLYDRIMDFFFVE